MSECTGHPGGYVDFVKLSHEVLEPWLVKGGVALDATVGNGGDTLFLAERLGPDGRVYGFDVQGAALAGARELLRGAGIAEERVVLFQRGHEELECALPVEARGRVCAAIFNLGYLPRHDHAVTTRVGSTLRALQACAHVVGPNGALAVVYYPGHEEGLREGAELAREAEAGFLASAFPGRRHWPSVKGRGGRSSPGLWLFWRQQTGSGGA